MLGERYVVQKGDNLWRIAARRLGHGREWPRIWRYNNRRQVIAVTGRGIPNPDLLRINQVLLLPILPSTPVATGNNSADDAAAKGLPTALEQTAPSTSPSGSSLDKSLPSMRSPIAFKYKLDDLAWPPQDVGVAIIQVKLTGDVMAAQAGGHDRHVPLLRDGREDRARDHAQARPSAATGPPSAVRDVVVARARPKAPMAAPGASAPDAFDTWVFVAGMGLTVTAVGIVTATVVEDFLTGGIGVADDAPSFALAAGTLASGLAMMGVGAALPKAEQPALVPGKTTLTLGPKM